VRCDTGEEIKHAKEVLKQTSAEDITSTGGASVDGKKTDRDVAAKTVGGNR